jgi:transcriptional regulator with PAS, ATPase and Fis domain
VVTHWNRQALEVKEGRFREDLFYRINVIEIKVPPLRDRKEDIPLLASRFAHEFSEKEQKKVRLSEQVVKALREHHWPGNVRQLRNVISGQWYTRERLISLADLPRKFNPPEKHRKERSGNGSA